MITRKRRFLILSIFLIGFGTQGILQVGMDKNLVAQKEQTFMYLPDGNIFKHITLGFNVLAADIYWIRTVIYFGRFGSDADYPFQSSELVKSTPSRPDDKSWEDHKLDLLYNLLNLITDLDPYFYFPYEFGGLFLSMKNGEIERALEILNKGQKVYPDRYNIPFLKGFNYLFYLNDKQAALREFLQAIQLPDCPLFVVNLIRGISYNIPQKDLALEFLEGANEASTKKEVKEELEKIIEELKKNPV